MAPDVGPSCSVDDGVAVRPRGRRSDRDTGFGSLDRSSESRLATPEDFRGPATFRDNYTPSGGSSAVLREDLRHSRRPKNVTFRGIRRGRRDSFSSLSGDSASDQSGDGSPRLRRYGGCRGRALSGPSDTPADVTVEGNGHLRKSRGGGAKPRRLAPPAPPHPATSAMLMIGGRSGPMTIVQRSGLGATVVAGLVAGLSPVQPRPLRRQRAAVRCRRIGTVMMKTTCLLDETCSRMLGVHVETRRVGVA